MKKRIAVLMSGGVDSSVAAYLLKKEGYDVVGITLKVWQEKCEKMHSENCCGPRAVADVRSVCKKIGIPFYLLNLEKEFKKLVIDYFCAEYSRARTPNPCVVCNDRIKFGVALKKAEELGASRIATGHYAAIEHLENNRFVIRKGEDRKKDQSYFLFNLTQDQLEKTIFPVGSISKDEVRKVARELGLRVHDKKDSTEICFIPDNNYKGFLKSENVEFLPGNVINKDREVLGTHDGMQLFTIGQRKGIGIAAKNPYYIIKLDASNNSVVVGDNEDLLRKVFVVDDINWMSVADIKSKMKVDIKIRYNSPAVSGEIEPCGNGRVKAVFDKPQRAVTPGQAAVFYQGDKVIGGGWISDEEE